jgi:hypothetical protein
MKIQPFFYYYTSKVMNPLEKAIALIDAENAKDPNADVFENQSYPKELLYSNRMYEKLLEFHPSASHELIIAAKAQHICRWKSERSSYSNDRVGYLKWRTDLKKFHAETTSKILSEVGYNQDFIDRVCFLIEKKSFKSDFESQTLEDVVCLVFLAYYFDPFVVKHDREKVISIIVKTWHKMSENGHAAALKIPFSSEGFSYIKEALNL